MNARSIAAACLSTPLASVSTLFLLTTNVHGQAPHQEWVESIPDHTNPCVANATAGYHLKQCYVEVDRDQPISPPTINVPGGTKVYIKLHNPHWDESVAFNSTVAQTTPLNPIVDALTSLASPLSNLQSGFHAMIAVQEKNSALFDAQATVSTPDDSWKAPSIALQARETAITTNLTATFSQVQEAGARYTCLENYRQFDNARGSCNYNPPLTHDSLADARTAATTASASAGGLPVPADDITLLGTDLTNFTNTCNAIGDPASKTACKAATDSLQAVKAGIDATVKDIQTAQDALRQADQQVDTLALQQPPPDLFFEINEPFWRTATVAITGTEVVTKTATTVASVVVNWQQTGFVLSTGLLGSGLASRTYATSSIIVNGVVQTDPTTGKNLTIVTSTNTEPAMDFPMVYGSYVVPFLNQFTWENSCPGHCGFLLSGGAGLNLTAKTADFAVGPSFQYWGILVTPSLVIGRQSVLTDRITVGYTGFGVNPPTALPTTMAWKRGFGIGLTYTIPLL